MSAETITVGVFFRRFAIVLFVGLCFGFSQFAGWAVMGTMLADNQVRRDDAALKGDLVRGDLKSAAADYQALAGTPSVGEAQAAIDALLAIYVKAGKGTVGTLTSNCEKPDWAPQTCRKVADARGVLEKARRRDALKETIEKGGSRLDGAEKVADGAVEVAVPVGLAQRLGFAGAGEADKHAAEDAARFFRVVFLVAFVGLVATFGFALVGVTHRDVAKGPALIAENPMVIVPLIFLLVEGGMNAIFGWRQAGGGFFNFAAWLQAAMYFSAAVLGAYLPTAWDRAREPSEADKYPALAKWDFGPVRLGAPVLQAPRDIAPEANPLPSAYAQGYPAVHGAAGYASGPINVNLSVAHAPHVGAHGADGASAGAPMPPEAARVGRVAPDVTGVPAREAHELLPPRETPLIPVDRSAYERARFEQEAVDALLTFEAACVIKAPGASVACEQMYGRYWNWCGGAGLGRNEFDQLFAHATQLQRHTIGEVDVWGHVALRETVQLRRA
jgi:hypothetical protein